MTRKALILSAGIVGMIAGTAGAQCTWQGDDVNNPTSWNDPDNWSCGHVPTSSDDVVIPPLPGINPSYPIVDVTGTIQSLDVQEGTVQFTGGHDLTVTGALNVEDGGTIDINSGGSKLVVSGANSMDVDSGGAIEVSIGTAQLELTADSSGTGHILDGSIALSVSGAILNISTNSVKFTGSGQLLGEDAGAQIQIASGKTLTNAMNDASGVGLGGVMQITGAGTFVNQGRVTGQIVIASSAFTNQGRVEADGGTLEVSSTTISDTSGANRWVVAGTTSSRLLFSTSAATLAGNFVLEKELELATGIDVYTCGQLTYNSGASIDLDSAGGKDFRYDTFDAGSTCTNPFDLDNVSGCGGTVFEVNTDKAPCS